MITVSLAMALPFFLAGVPLFFVPMIASMFYIVFKSVESERQLVIPKAVNILMKIAIAIVTLWIAALLYASTIRGGGPAFMVAQYAVFTSLPAIVVLLFLDLIVLFKSYGKHIGNIFLVVVALVAGARIAMPYMNDYSREAQWKEYCAEAKDEFNLKDENIERLEFYNFVSNGKYSESPDGQMNINGREYMGVELIKRGVIEECEVVAKGMLKHYKLIFDNGEPVKVEINANEANATHRVAYQRIKYSTGHKSPWFTKQVISITNKKTGKVVARRVQFIDLHKKDRSCAQIYNGQISAVDFIEKAIEKSRK